MVFYLKSSNIYQRTVLNIVLKSYLNKRYFFIKRRDVVIEICEIRSGVRGSVLGSLLYLLFTADLSIDINLSIPTFTDTIAILTIHRDPSIMFKYLQENLKLIQNWLKFWRIRVKTSQFMSHSYACCNLSCCLSEWNSDSRSQRCQVSWHVSWQTTKLKEAHMR